MKFQIRRGCFETNSSSMHSLIMTKKNSGICMTQEEIRAEQRLDTDWGRGKKANVWHIYNWSNEFGRSPFDVLCTFSDKLKYALAEYCGNCYGIASYLKAEETFDEMFKPLIIRLTGCDDVKLDMESESFEIYTDVPNEYLDECEEVPYEKLVYRENREDGESLYLPNDKDGRPIETAYFKVPCFGGIDHQSNGVLRRFLAKNNMTLEDYLVRKDVCVIVDGDEYCVFGSLIDCGLVDKKNIVSSVS